MYRSSGVSELLRERFADGEWHPVDVATEACWDLVPTEIATRHAGRRPAGADADAGWGWEWTGKRHVVAEALRQLGAEFEHAPPHRMRVRFRLAQMRPAARVGERHASARLTEAAVLDLRRRYKEGGVTLKQLATESGVSQSAIQGVISGKTWRSVRPAPEQAAEG